MDRPLRGRSPDQHVCSAARVSGLIDQQSPSEDDRHIGPLISICVPTYNPIGSHLSELFASITAQRFARIEVVVCDDASEIDPREFIDSIRGDLCFHHVRHRRTKGMVGNWNATVACSNGPLVMVVHQDDVLGPGMLHAYAAEFETDPETVLCSGGEVFIDSAGERLNRSEPVNRRSRIFRRQERYVLSQADLIRLSLRNGQAYGEPSAVMFRRSVFEAVNGYRPAFEHAADVDFNIRCSAVGKAVYLSTPYLRRRIHDSRLTQTHVVTGASSRDRVRLQEAYGNDRALSGEDRYRLRVALVSHALYDAARALGRFDLRITAANVRLASRYAANPWRFYRERIRELVTKVNLDER